MISSRLVCMCFRSSLYEQDRRALRAMASITSSPAELGSSADASRSPGCSLVGGSALPAHLVALSHPSPSTNIFSRYPSGGSTYCLDTTRSSRSSLIPTRVRSWRHDLCGNPLFHHPPRNGRHSKQYGRHRSTRNGLPHFSRKAAHSLRGRSAAIATGPQRFRRHLPHLRPAPTPQACLLPPLLPPGGVDGCVSSGSPCSDGARGSTDG